MENSELLTKAPIVNYKDIAIRLLKTNFPEAPLADIEEAVNIAIEKSYKEVPASINNNYKNVVIHPTLLEIADYIETRKPIVTSYGVLFQQHEVAPNPLAKMIKGFIEGRAEMKKEMFKYPKGSEMYEKYNLLQLLLKIDANGTYGALGMYSCVFYNIYVASSITTQGRSYISSAILLFESFMDDNVPFGSLNEVLTFIDSVKNEKRVSDDSLILDRQITLEEVFYKIMSNVGFGFIPTEKDCEIVWDILAKSTPEDLNRLFYKNNLFSFMDNKVMSSMVVELLKKLKTPFTDPNSPPDEIKVELSAFYDLLMEYVYYKEVFIDKLDKAESLVRTTSIITDTDSTFVSFDGWFRYVYALTVGVDMPIKHEYFDMVKYYEEGEKPQLIEYVEDVDDYDFYEDDIVQVRRSVDLIKLIPEDNLRYSIVNIMAYCLGNMVNDYMEKVTANAFSNINGRKCVIIMKNEIQLKRALLSDGKKNYAGIQELQEGHVVPKEKSLDVKGMPVFIKSTVNEKTKETLKKILYDDILNADNVDQIKVLKSLARAEKDIINSINSGSKEYYKPLKVKSLANYEKPMSQQGIKASIVYNALKDDNLEALDLESRNSIDVVKVDITPDNISRIKDDYPEVYQKALNLMTNDQYFASGIDVIGLPLNVDVPKWVLQFVRHSEIVNDNIAGFPLESIGLFRNDSSYINYTNIVTL